MFSYISSQGWMRGQKHSLFCLLPVTHHFTLSCTPKTPNCLNNTAVLVLNRSFKMFYWKILLNSVNLWLIHSIFTSLWFFFHPPAQHVSHAFRPCSRHSDFSRQAAVSFHAGLIWLAARPSSETDSYICRSWHSPSCLLPTAGPRAYQHSSYPCGTSAQGCSFPAGRGPHGLEEMQMSPQAVGQAQGPAGPEHVTSHARPGSASTGSACASTCPGGAGAGSLRLQSNRLNTNNVTLTSEPEWIHSTDFYYRSLNY